MRHHNVIWFVALLVTLCVFRAKILRTITGYNSGRVDAWKKTKQRERSSRSVLNDQTRHAHSEWIDTLQPWIKPTSPKPELPGFKIKRLPQVIGIGVKKCGTGALHYFLKAHPRIKTLLETEEAHFFDQTFQHKQGLDHYRSLFEDASDKDVVFEKTPDYLFRPRVPSRIEEWNRDVKLIAVLCDPVIRAFSDYDWMTTFEPISMRTHMNYTSFDEYVDESIADLNDIKQGDYKALGYGTFHSFVRSSYNHRTFPLTGLTYGMYVIHLKDWYTHFPFNQIHIVDGERLIRSPGPVMEEVQRFIGIDVNITTKDFYWDEEKGFYYLNKKERLGNKGKHRGPRGRKMSEHAMTKLIQFFKPYNEELYALLNKRLDWLYFASELSVSK